MSNIDTVLHSIASLLPPTLSAVAGELRQLYEQRLWHQLSQLLEKLSLESSASKSLPILFNDFVMASFQGLCVADKLSPESVLRLGVRAARQLSPADACLLLERLSMRFKDVNDEVYVRCIAELCSCRVAAGNAEGGRSLIRDTLEPAINSLTSVPVAVQRTAEWARAEVARAQHDYSAYYASIIGFISDPDYPQAEHQLDANRAAFLCTSALLSDTVYNFGELLLLADRIHFPDSAKALIELIRAFNAGDIANGERLLAPAPIEKKHHSFLKRKLQLMAVAEGVFRIPRPQRRRILLSEVAEIAHCGIESVDLLLLEAFARGILGGCIDQLSGTVDIRHVQPRVLDADQIGELGSAFGEWRQRVTSLISFIQDASLNNPTLVPV